MPPVPARVDIDEVLARANEKFGGLSKFVNQRFDRLSFSLQAEVQGIITDLLVRGIQGEIAEYVARPLTLRDGTTVQGQSAFDRIVREDKDVYGLIERYRPSKLKYVRAGRKIREFIAWDSAEFARIIAAYLEEEHGLRVGGAGLAYLERTCDRFKSRIYGR